MHRNAGNVTMITRIFLFSLLTVLGACASSLPEPTLDDLDWNPPRISTSGCPNLSGRYVLLAPHGTQYSFLFLGGTPSTPGLMPDAKTYQRDKNLDVFITVESRANGLYVKAENTRASTDVFTDYDGVRVGCSGNMLVSRYMRKPTMSPESGWVGHTSIVYGEKRVFLSGPNRDIHVVSAQRTRCATYTSLKHVSPGGPDAPLGCQSYDNPPPYVFKRIAD